MTGTIGLGDEYYESVTSRIQHEIDLSNPTTATGVYKSMVEFDPAVATYMDLDEFLEFPSASFDDITENVPSFDASYWAETDLPDSIPFRYNVWDTNGYSSSNQPTFEAATARARENVAAYADDFGDGSTHGGTNFEEYTSPGPKENYTETIVQYDPPPTRPADPGLPTTINHPGRQPESAAYQEPFTGGHYPEENVLWHSRSSTRPVYPDNTPIHHTEEVQADWLQAAHEKGFATTDEDLSKLTADDLVFSKNSDGSWDAFTPGHRKVGRHPEDPEELRRQVTEHLKTLRDNPKTLRDNPDVPLNIITGLPPAPYLTDWRRLALQNEMRKAVEAGLPGITIPQGSEHIRRYGSYLTPDQKQGLKANYDTILPRLLNSMGKKYGARVQPMRQVTSQASDNGFANKEALEYATKLQSPDDLYTEQDLFGWTVRDKSRNNAIMPRQSDTNRNDPSDQYIQRSMDRLSEHYPEAGTVFADEAAAKYERNTALRNIAKQTQRVKGLMFTPAMIEAIKKGTPLSLLAPLALAPDDESR